MCSSTTYVVFGPKRMLAVTPTNLLRLRPYDLSDARHLVEEKLDDEYLHNHYFVQLVLKVINKFNYETARSFVQGKIPLYEIHYSENKVELKTNKSFISQQQQLDRIKKPDMRDVYLLINTRSKAKTLKKPVPVGHYYLINGEVYRSGLEPPEDADAQTFYLKFKQRSYINFEFYKGIQYKKIDAIVVESKI